MVTVGEKTADVATLIDDIAATLTGLSSSPWSDADTDVTNDGSDDNWKNNGRVLENPNSGTYLLLFVSGSEQYLTPRNTYDSGRCHVVNGVRTVHSTGWDSANTAPSGDTTVFGNDPMSGSVSNTRRDSFADHRVEGSNGNIGGHGIWPYTSNGPKDGEGSSNRSTVRSKQVTYFLSGDTGGLRVGAYNSTDGNDGAASFFVFDYTGQKLWSDGETPVTIVTRMLAGDDGDNYGRGAINSYGFAGYYCGGNERKGRVSANGGTINQPHYGTINPDGGDDSFFVERPVFFRSHNQNVPVGSMNGVLPNDIGSGGAHGDTVTLDGVSHRVFKQAGGAERRVISAALRFD